MDLIRQHCPPWPCDCGVAYSASGQSIAPISIYGARDPYCNCRCCSLSPPSLILFISFPFSLLYCSILQISCSLMIVVNHQLSMQTRAGDAGRLWKSDLVTLLINVCCSLWLAQWRCTTHRGWLCGPDSDIVLVTIDLAVVTTSLRLAQVREALSNEDISRLIARVHPLNWIVTKTCRMPNMPALKNFYIWGWLYCTSTSFHRTVK